MCKIIKPNIRFSEYTDEWEECKLSDGLTEYTDRVFIEDNKKPELLVNFKNDQVNI